MKLSFGDHDSAKGFGVITSLNLFKIYGLLLLLLSRTASRTTKYIHQRVSPLVRLLGGEGTIPKSTHHVTVVTDQHNSGIVTKGH